MISKKRALRCVTHHYGCNCREYKMQEMESVLRVIRTWAYLYLEKPGHTDSAKKIMLSIESISNSALNCYEEDK